MILDVNSPLPNESINQDDPSSSYDSAYLNRTFAILDAFREFPNTLGVSTVNRKHLVELLVPFTNTEQFFSANELINTAANSVDAPWIRAVSLLSSRNEAKLTCIRLHVI